MTASADALVVAVLAAAWAKRTSPRSLACVNAASTSTADHVAVVPALYGRNADRVREVAERYGVERTSTRMDELIDAPDVAVVDNCLSNHLHYGPLMRAIDVRESTCFPKSR